jgi:hypothetical protein
MSFGILIVCLLVDLYCDDFVDYSYSIRQLLGVSSFLTSRLTVNFSHPVSQQIESKLAYEVSPVTIRAAHTKTHSFCRLLRPGIPLI